MELPGSHRRGKELTDDALNDAFARWQDELLGTLYFLIENSDAAHDALQRTFVKCWRRRGYLAESPNLRAAVFRIALNTGRDYQTERAKKSARETPKPPSDEGEEEPTEVELLRRAILGLRLEERRIFLLRQNGRLEYDEIGKTVNMPVETVKTRMRLALRKLSRAVWPEDRADCQSYLELLYGILSDDETVRCRIQAESSDAAEKAEALQSRIGEASRRKHPKVVFPDPADFPSPSRPILRRRAARRRLATRRRKMANPWGRALSWAASLSMIVLLAVSVGGYLYHRDQLAGIAEEHMRLIVTGPGQIRAGGLNRYTVSTTSVTGRPIPVRVNLSVYDSDGKLIYEHTEKTDARGRLLVTLPEDLRLPKGAWIEALAVHENQVRRATTRPFQGNPAGTAYLAADRRAADPGGRVRLRAVVLRCVDLTPAPDGAVRFALQDSDGKEAASLGDEVPLRDGSASAELSIPETIEPGEYRIVVKSTGAAFPETAVPLTVAEPSGENTKPSGKNTEPSGTNEEPADAKLPEAPDESGKSDESAKPDRIEVRFYPEGGSLVANLENRIYFEAARGGVPFAVSGRVVDDEGNFVAAVETTRDGRGLFSLVPRPERNYRFVLERSGKDPFERLLPTTDTRKNVVVDTGVGVFEPGKPLEFNVRAGKAGLPLVASASVRGVQIGETPFSTKIGPNGQTANPVVVEIPPETAGAIRLTVWDYSTSPPRPLAERLVFRLPTRRLQIGRLPKEDVFDSGADVAWDVTVAASAHGESDTNGDAKSSEAPTPGRALLGVTAIPAAGSYPSPGLKPSVLLEGAFHGGAPSNIPASLLDGSPESNTALDLLLATRGWRCFTDEPRDDAVAERVKTWPALSDNLAELQTRYLDCLAAYQAGRTRILNALTTLSAFGGLAILFLLGMTAMLGIPTGARLWVPGAVTAGVCLVVGSILMHPDRLNDNPDGRSAFATDYGARPAGSTAKHYFRCYSKPLFRPESKKATTPRRDGDAALLWNPALRTDKAGRVRLSWPDAPTAAGAYRIRVDGYALGEKGMLGAAEWTVAVKPPPAETSRIPGSTLPPPEDTARLSDSVRGGLDTLKAFLNSCMQRLSPSATN